MAGALPAVAAPGGGAIVQDVHECHKDTPTRTVCTKDHIVFNQTTSGSGIINLSGSASLSLTLTDTSPEAACSSQAGKQTAHFHALIKPNSVAPREQHDLESNSSVVTCGGVTFTCNSTLEVHFVDGVAQFERQSFECSVS